MYDIQADVGKNRLSLVLKGFMNVDETKAAAEEAVAQAKTLKSGFTVINDITEFKPSSAEGAEHIKWAQMEVQKMGVGRVIRVIGKSQLGKMQFERTQKDAGYQADVAATMEEAEKLAEIQ